MTVMTRDDLFGDDQFNDDPYRSRVNDAFNGGIAGPNDGGFPAPAAQPSGGYDLEKFRNAWYGKGDVNNIQGWLDQNKAFTSGVTIRNGQHAYDPSGRYIADLVGNLNDPNQAKHAQFLDGIDSNTGQKRTAKPAKAAKAPAMPAPVPAANNFLTQIRQLIMDRMGKMNQDPSLDDPALAAQSQAYRRSRERGADDQRAAMAERAAANGLLSGGQSSGAFDTELMGIQEAKGEDIAGNDARLLGGEVQARRAEVMSLLNMALQSGDAESARELQTYLAQLDAQLRREGLAESGRQFDASDKYRYDALGQQGQMFNDQFGRQLNRDYEDDYRYRVGLGLGG